MYNKYVYFLVVHMQAEQVLSIMMSFISFPASAFNLSKPGLHRDRQTVKETDRDGHAETDRQTQKEAGRQREADRQRHTGRYRQRERQREGDRQTLTDRKQTSRSFFHLVRKN